MHGRIDGAVGMPKEERLPARGVPRCVVEQRRKAFGGVGRIEPQAFESGNTVTGVLAGGARGAVSRAELVGHDDEALGLEHRLARHGGIEAVQMAGGAAARSRMRA